MTNSHKLVRLKQPKFIFSAFRRPEVQDRSVGRVFPLGDSGRICPRLPSQAQVVSHSPRRCSSARCTVPVSASVVTWPSCFWAWLRVSSLPIRTSVLLDHSPSLRHPACCHLTLQLNCICKAPVSANHVD